jgi:hypothetical protein
MSIAFAEIPRKELGSQEDDTREKIRILYYWELLI